MIESRAPFLAAGSLCLALSFAILLAEYDRAIMHAVYLQPLWLLPVMRVLTLYCSWWFLGAFGVLAMLLAHYHLRGDLAQRVGLGMVAAAGFVEAAKFVLARSRPDFLHQVPAAGSSFPSGHATSGMVIWVLVALTLGTLSRRFRPLVFLLYLLPLLGGWTRVYLGVHWPSDVLGGWGFGLLLVALIAGRRRQAPAPWEGEQPPEARVTAS